MLTIRIIPCLDVKNGRVVKGINFIDLRDAGDPLEQAKFYDKSGADELCFLDITASNERREILFDVVSKTAENCFMKHPGILPTQMGPNPRQCFYFHIWFSGI